MMYEFDGNDFDPENGDCWSGETKIMVVLCLCVCLDIQC